MIPSTGFTSGGFMHRTRLVALALFALSLAADPVRTQSGLVSGTSAGSPDVRVYKGIPYAAPPLGDLRWKVPQPVAAWQGVRDAGQYSATCMQTPYPAASIYYSEPQPVSEDCLYLNVWTAAKSTKERRPVMVWIHGGAFTRGAGSTPTYDGEKLAAKGVVLVTINYRLGVFGFLAHPELTGESAHHSSGNYALLDQIAALEWVQKNIASFGGDSKRVTIFGESAGSWAVNYLMATPVARGLFHRVIGESGASFGPNTTLATAEKSGEKFAAAIGAADLKALRAKPADELLKASGAASFPPNVDGWLLSEDIRSIFEHGKQNDVPLIAGFNADEGTTLSPWPASGTAKSFAEQARRTFGKQADDFLKIYPAATDDEARAAHYNSFRDQRFGWQMRTWVRASSQTGRAKTYLYYFSRVPPSADSARYRAYHAAEISYVFGNFRPGRPWEDTDHKLSDAMSSYWVNFAATGDPNGKGLAKWPAYDATSDTALEFGNQVELRRALHKDGLDFFDRYYESLRSAAPSNGSR
jgi:para-nitrobenzyl esterase